MLMGLIGVFYPVLPAEAAVVNSVQRGSVIMPPAINQPVTVNINAVDPGRAFVVCSPAGFPANTTITSYTALVVDYNAGNASNVMCALSSPTTITLHGAPESVGQEVFWFVVDFQFGVRVQRGTADISSRALPFNPYLINISPVNVSRSFVIFSKSNNISTPQGRSSYYLRANLMDLDTLELVRGTSGLGQPGFLYLGLGEFSVAWQVIEFEDSVVQRGLLEMDAFTRTVRQTVNPVNLGKTIFLASYYGLYPDSFGSRDNYPVMGIDGNRTITFSRPDDGQLVRIAWQAAELTDASTVQQPMNAVTFGREQPPGIAPILPPLTARRSFCNLICPTGVEARSSSEVLLRISNPNGPAINTSVAFNIPAEINPTNLPINAAWDQAQRLLTVVLGSFQVGEEKQVPLSFEGEPAGCIIYGALQGEWSPRPPAGPPNWQQEINFSTVLPDEQCAATPIVQQQLDNILRETLRQTVGLGAAIRDLLETLRQSEIIQQVGLPTAVGVGAAGAASAAASTPFLWNLLELLRFILLGFMRFKKRKPWGLVFDEVTRQPIAGAIVKILDTEFQKVKETQISDANGRFGFLVPAGSYYLKVSKSGYKDEETSVFAVKDPTKEAPNLELAMSSLSGETDLKKLNWLKTLNDLRRLLYLLNPYLLTIGTILSVFMFVVFPTIINYAVLMVYVILDAYKIWLATVTVRPYGRVLDHSNRDPLPLSIVRAFNKSNNWLTATHVSDVQGRFNFLVTPGSYYMTADKDGYRPFKSESLDFRKPGIVNKDIELKRGT